MYIHCEEGYSGTRNDYNAQNVKNEQNNLLSV